MKNQMRKRSLLASLLVSLLVPVTGFAESGDRLVTIGPGVTEIVYALKQGDKVIATDASSRTPAPVNGLPKVGYYRNLSAEGLLSLKLDHLMGTVEMGPPIVLEQMKQAGVRVTVLSGGPTLESLQERIRQVSDILGAPEAGEKLWQKNRNELSSAKALSEEQKPLKVIFMMAHTGTAVLAGDKTTVNSLIALSGGVNPVKSQFSGYKPVSAESLLVMAPDVILIGQSTMNKEGSAKAVLKLLPGIQATPAGRSAHILTVDDGILMGGLGPRVGEAALKLATQMYGTGNQTAVAKN